MRWTFASPDAADALAERASFMAFLRHRGRPGEDYNAVEVVYGEIVGNVVRHARGPIEIVLDWSNEAPTLAVRDRGPGFTYAGSSPRGTDDECGRGMFLIESFADRLSVEPNPGGGSRVSVALRIRRAVAASRLANVELAHSE